ncbi:MULTISPECIES: carboxymuconolactone decarboxylase family protein [unclassified Nocardia]|uniref:carboxymuconolactone decarboxylase family protein n=1 Tax=unclassified Nocardia TaxID=2637762 RepID=UPI0024A995C1|nr:MULTISPECIES: carboxymuconolactone decarboxylase family protein [unclassified Nocardia]
MSTLPLVSADRETPEQTTALSAVRQALGSTPNLTRVMVHSPALVHGYLAMAGNLAEGVLSAATRERLAIAVAQSNGCSYCLSAHSYLGENVAGLSREQVGAARKADADDPKTAALLAFAVAVNEQRGDVGDDVVATVRAAGATEAEIAEVIGHVALNVLTNYLNNAARTEIDFPVVQA